MSQTPRSRTAICALAYLALIAPLAAGLTACSAPATRWPTPRTTPRGRSGSAPRTAAGKVGPEQAAQGDLQGRRPNHRRDRHRRHRPLREGRTQRRRYRVAQHRSARRRHPLHRPGEHRERRRQAGPRGRSPSTPGRPTTCWTSPSARRPAPTASASRSPPPLSKPVKDHAARAVVERALHVTSSPAVTGSWYWVDDRTLHYRPEAVLARPRHRHRQQQPGRCPASSGASTAAPPSRCPSTPATRCSRVTDAGSARDDRLPRRRGGQHHPGDHRQARLLHPQRHQGRAGEAVVRPDEEQHRRHRRRQLRLLRPAGLLGHPGDLER